MRRGRKLLNVKCEPKLSEVNGNSLTGSSGHGEGRVLEKRTNTLLKQKDG